MKKINYDKLKKEFFLSEIENIEEFFINKKLKKEISEKGFKNKTKSWKKDKKAFNKQILDKTSLKAEKKYEKEFEKIIDKMIIAKNNGIQDLITDLSGSNEGQILNVKERLEILKFIKTELGESTEISETKVETNAYQVIFEK